MGRGCTVRNCSPGPGAEVADGVRSKVRCQASSQRLMSFTRYLFLKTFLQAVSGVCVWRSADGFPDSGHYGRKRFRAGWTAFIVIFFLFFVILPTVYILSYAHSVSSIEEFVLDDPDMMRMYSMPSAPGSRSRAS